MSTHAHARAYMHACTCTHAVTVKEISHRKVRSAAHALIGTKSQDRDSDQVFLPPKVVRIWCVDCWPVAL